jgi:ADP-ribose pyrophosphatase YjhB (NUDIX family)
VPMSPHVARLRAALGSELILLPSVTILPLDADGRLLLGRHTEAGGAWATVGGAVEIGEAPATAARREAQEEIGVEVRLTRLVDVLGGPDFEIVYRNGDRSAYVTAVYEAEIAGGVPTADQDELTMLGWFSPDELATITVSAFTRAVLRGVGRL